MSREVKNLRHNKMHHYCSYIPVGSNLKAAFSDASEILRKGIFRKTKIFFEKGMFVCNPWEQNEAFVF